MDRTDKHTQGQLRTDLPDFRPGDTISVEVWVREGNKERIQRFDGIVIKKKGSGIKATFLVRKISSGVGVERVFLLHSPSIAKINVLKTGHVRRAKLYYLRKKRGKAARVKDTKKALVAGEVPVEPAAEAPVESAETVEEAVTE